MCRHDVIEVIKVQVLAGGSVAVRDILGALQAVLNNDWAFNRL